MKIWKILLSALPFLLVTCGKTPEPDPVKLVANPAELEFGPEGGTQTITITSGIQPSVNTLADWAAITSGTGSGTSWPYTVKVPAYNGTLDRSTSLRVIGDKQSLMIPILQHHPEVEMTVSKASLSFSRSGGEETFTVSSSTQPYVTSDASWLVVETGKIDKDHNTTVKVQAGANRKAEAGSGTLTVSCGGKSVSVSVAQEAFAAPAVATATTLTPQMVFDAMGPGWNMGNHMDAINNGVSGETLWGNPKCTQATMDGVKAAGYKAVRICTTWEGHIGPAPAYRIEDKWLDRVAEIVGYAERAGLVAIVNTHHDETYWQDISKCINNAANHEKVKDEVFALWTQIAEKFKDKGEWLVFESFNEIQDGGWGWSDAFRKNPDAQYKILNEWNQTFVDAVRATGGQNATRWLGIPGYACNPGFTIAGLVLPKDYTDANRLMVAVHDYDPYDYTLKNPFVRQWGHTAAADQRLSGDNEKAVVDVFDNLKTAYLDKGIPVYLGEMGCSRHEKDDLPYQRYYMEYFCKAAADHLLPMYLWDNGAKGTGSETHAYIDHGTGKFVDEEAKTLVGLMVKAVTTKDPAYTLQSVYDAAP
jgi:Endoglucanase|uniref:Putative carbohydrate-active enzyme n=1 Tax=uncultured organism TaxID=155900 RepID=E9NSN4_9ZZZZ|nr:putative carbohydrate-active enzyme [uncultured organism]